MPTLDSGSDQTPNDETKAKLRQIRTDYTRARHILDKLEAYYTAFDELRKKLDDDQDGLQVNLDWSQEKKVAVDAIIAGVNAKVTELETATTSIRTLVADVQAQHDTFVPLAARLTDPNSGIDAILTSATSLRNQITALAELASGDNQTVKAALASIQARSAEVEKAYDDFTELMESVNDPETGIAAQVSEVNQYAKDALKAKTSAESELASVISLKSSVTEHLEDVKTSKEEIDGYKEESQNLTNDIRNTLGLTSAYSLSRAIEDQRKRLDKSLRRWGWAVFVTAVLLAGALSFVFIMLFLDSHTKIATNSSSGISIFLVVISKALFASPFIFALYFTTSNYGRTRDFRDRYLSKEIAGKNLQAYTKLLRDEFSDREQERLDFALHNMQAIYDDPVMRTKKRSYNFGMNKIFQIGIEEETEQLKNRLIEGAEEIVSMAKPSK